MTGAKVHADMTIAVRMAWVLALIALALASANAHAASAAPSNADQQCLACHGTKGLEKKLPSGETLPLHVEGSTFAKSVHGSLGCGVCHSDVTLENHPPLKKKVTSVRENSLALQKVCSSCHADKFKLYEGSIHAALLRDGNPAAPVCTDCHSPHEIMPKASFDVATGAPCGKCHGSIFEAYLGSVHGLARKQGRAEAPVCSTCHSAHDVKAAAGQDNLRHTCFGCHSGALSAHQKWLPNAERHLATISCSACHAPGAKRKVDLRLYDGTGQERIAERLGVPVFETRARAVDTEDKGLDASELQRLLRQFDDETKSGKAILRGRLEVDGGVEVHQLADKTKALHQCETCHSSGSAAFQRVTISVTDPSGRLLRYDAKQDILTSARSVDSIRGFYVIGGTRIKLLDVLVVLALLAGIGTPIVHLTLSWLFRKYAKRIGGREDS
ncbi:MAG: cytochrome c3 family protein [Burkholderiales bacterium]